jgi:hypothetical protein
LLQPLAASVANVSISKVISAEKMAFLNQDTASLG